MSADELASLWSENKSLSEICELLGVSRGVVAGKVDRARKAGDERFQPRLTEPRSVIAEPAPAPAPKPVAPTPVEKTLRPRLLIDLGWSDCRWPVAEAPDGRHLFLGQSPGR
jgi:hypothetical protein